MYVVVDDPHGHVVPSLGVRIIGASMGKSLADASMMINTGPERVAELVRKREVDFPAPTHGRKKPRKEKQRLKGLRS